MIRITYVTLYVCICIYNAIFIVVRDMIWKAYTNKNIPC